MSLPTVSIIIPFYRAERFLGACLDSLLAQTYPQLEILCIGENVEDSSHAVAQHYADAQPDRIRFLLQTLEGPARAQGPGRARNMGMDNCTGAYFTFIDADDTVHPDYIRVLYDTLQRHNADFSCCGFERCNGKNGKVLSETVPSQEEECIVLSADTRRRMAFVYTAAWGKLYKGELRNFVRYSEIFPIACEDMVFFLCLLPHVQRVALTPQRLYNYTMYDSGMTLSFAPRNFQLSLDAIQTTCATREAAPPGHDAMLTLAAFIHVGIALVHRATQNGSLSYGESISRSRAFLDAYFPEWRRIGPLPEGRWTVRGLAVYVVKCLYIHGGAGIFMFCYNTATRFGGRDLKW